jgi:WD40 repeat protein/serine/threonine protein kinase
MSTTSGSRNPVEALAEEFLRRKRAGEDVSPEGYAEAHPELADKILSLFPALLMMEDLGGDPAERNASVLTGGGAIGGEAGRLGEYRLVREVGRGGMGVVYEAEQESLGRRVALKVLPPGAIADPKQLRRFEREARSAARLHHTNIVPVFGVGHHEGTHYYVMQLIEGQGLDRVLAELRRLQKSRAEARARKPENTRTVQQESAEEIALSMTTGRLGLEGDPPPGTATLPWSSPGCVPQPATVLIPAPGASSPSVTSDVASLSGTDRRFALAVARIGVQAAEAIGYAHGQGILHRDIKPSNLLLDRDGNVWVADFGLAKAIGAEDLTHTGDVVGTLRYIAPERFRGKGDARSDIYSLGLTLYEMLTLRPAYPETDNTRLIHQVTQEDPPKLRKLNRAIPPDLESIINKAIAREPGQRYATAGALAEDLRRFLDGRPILARRVTRAVRLWRWCRRNRVEAMLIAGIALALVLGTVVATAFAIRARQNAADARSYARQLGQEAERANLEARKTREEALRADREARRVRDEKRLNDRRLYQAEISMAHQAWQDGDLDLVRHHLQSFGPVRPEDTDLLGFEWYYLHRPCRPEVILNGATCVRYSPDGRSLAGGGVDGTVKIWDTADSREVRTLNGHRGSVTRLAFGPDGRTIASASTDHTVKLWDAASGQEVRALSGHTQPVIDVAFSVDGRRIATGSVDRTVKIWDGATGRELRTLLGHTGDIRGVSFSPDCRTLSSCGMDQTIRVWDAATGQEIRTIREKGPFGPMAYSRDGRFLATTGSDQAAKIRDAATGQVIHTLGGQSDEVSSVSFSRDGRLLAAASLDQTVKIYDVATGRELRTLRGFTGEVWSVSYAPDGRHVAAAGADQTVRVWTISAEQEPLTMRGHQGPVWGLAYGPDGRTLASAGPDRLVKLWDVATGLILLTLHGHASGVWAVAYSPDGRTLASAGHDHTIRLWDVATGRESRVLRGHADAVLDVAYGPDGRTLASAGLDRTVRLWDASTGRELRTLRGHTSQVNGVAYGPDDRTIASASSDQTVRVWDAATGQELHTLRGHTGIVAAVVYSPDGRGVASASFDHTVKLWDAATGQETQTLRGQSAAVREIAFTPDGRRIAWGGDDRTVRLGDVATVQELLALRGHAGYIRAVIFSPDGLTLASAGADGTIRLWDGTPLTPEAEANGEARRAVQSLFEESLPTTEVLDRIRRDPFLSDQARQRALALAVPYGRSLLVHEAERVVESLYGRPLFRSEVVASLRADTTLKAEVREEAIALADRIPENAGRLNVASWIVVSRPGAGLPELRLALKQAEAACRLVPDDGHFLNTLGVAQYRVGHFEEALSTLSRSEPINTASRGDPSPADLAFMALARHRLGQHDQARATLVRLREVMRSPELARVNEWQAFLREAEGLERETDIPVDPFAPGP